MEEKLKGITLRTVDYKDSDKILTVFTLENGKISVSAHGIRKATAKMKAMAEPFCFAESVLVLKSGRYTLKEINVIDTFYPIRTDIVKYYAGMTALEFTNLVMQENLEAGEFFVLLVEFLKKLAYSTENALNLLIVFLSQAVGNEGFSIDFNRCGRCGNDITERVFLSTADGCNCCENCKAAGDREYSFDTYKYIKSLLGGEGVSDNLSAKNALKFFAYYINNVSGVELRSLETLLNL